MIPLIFTSILCVTFAQHHGLDYYEGNPHFGGAYAQHHGLDYYGGNPHFGGAYDFGIRDNSIIGNHYGLEHNGIRDHNVFGNNYGMDYIHDSFNGGYHDVMNGLHDGNGFYDQHNSLYADQHIKMNFGHNIVGAGQHMLGRLPGQGRFFNDIRGLRSGLYGGHIRRLLDNGINHHLLGNIGNGYHHPLAGRRFRRTILHRRYPMFNPLLALDPFYMQVLSQWTPRRGLYAW